MGCAHWLWSEAEASVARRLLPEKRSAGLSLCTALWAVSVGTTYLQCCSQEAVGEGVLLRLLLANPLMLFLLLGF
jgi:hypothetical protein